MYFAVFINVAEMLNGTLTVKGINIIMEQLKVPYEIIEFANSIDQDEAAHYEPPHLDLYCLLCNL